MKIALISAANNIHTIRWANAFCARGHEVTVICCKNHAKNMQSELAEGVRLFPLKYPSPLGYYFNKGQLKKLVKREKFDVINIHYASGYGTLGRRARLKNALLNVWGSDVYIYPYNSKFSLKTIKKNLSYYNAVASTSNCMAEQCKRFVERGYFITPFGVDLQKFKPIEGVKPKDEIIFGTVKTLSPVYGIEDTIKAFIKLIERLKKEKRDDLVKRLRYEIYGKGELKDSLQQLIDKSEMSQHIILCGYVDNRKLAEIYNRFTVFNANSYSESFGVVAVEAMACGIPVQLSNAEGFCEVVEEGVTGLIAPKGDVEAIAENMYKLLIDEALREKMGKAGVERVKKLYDWNANVDAMLEIYTKL